MQGRHVYVIGGEADSLVRFRGDLLKELVDSGHKVTTSAYGRNDEIEEQLCSWGCHYMPHRLGRLSINPNDQVAPLISLIRTLRREQPDIVMSYTMKPMVFGSIAARCSGVPRIVSLVTGLGRVFVGDTLQTRLLRGAVKAQLRLAFSCCDTVVFQNREDQLQLLNEGVLSNSKSTHVVNGSGVNLDHFSLTAPPVEPVSFLLAARLIEEKGVRLFVEAAKVLRKEFGERVAFTILGGQDDGSSAIPSHELDRWKDEGVVSLAGWHSDVRPFLEKSSIFVLPTYYREGVPRSILEALSMGRPVITTDTPGCRQTVRGCLNGRLIAPRSLTELCAAMRFFALNPMQIGPMGKESRKIAEDIFDVRIVNNTLLDIIFSGV